MDAVIRNQRLRDRLAGAVGDLSADHLLALYRELLVTEQLFFVATSGAEGRVGSEYVGPEDKYEWETGVIPEGGEGIIAYADLRSAMRSKKPGTVASMAVGDAFRWALEARMGLILANLESSHPTGCDCVFIPPEHIGALALGQMPEV
ncbi:MAG: hypothetical protein ACJ79T_10745 [Myxococcales bacterium]